MKRFVLASFLLVLTFPVAGAEENISVYITKVEGNRVTFRRLKSSTEETTLTVSKEAKIGTGKLNKDTKMIEVDMSLEQGLNDPVFSTGKTRARITINNNKDRV